jgi:hypothetical protein
MKIKAESIILIFIVILLLMFSGYLGYLIYLTIFYKKKTLEGYDSNENINQKFKRLQGITNICTPEDADYNSPECVNVKFYDYDDSVRSIKAILDPGYGVDPSTGFVVKIDTIAKKTKDPNYKPNGMFERSYDDPSADDRTPFPKRKSGILKSLEKNQLLSKAELSRLDKDNQDIEYHPDPAKLPNAKDDLIGYGIEVDDDGKIKEVPFSKLKGKTLYNQPGNSRFGPSSYVPNYEETVYLSKLTNQTYFENVPFEESGSHGFCQNKSLDDIEEKCKSLDNQTCASTECCILFGGAKCVAGNSTGPSKQSNYNDFLVKNRDYYYYKGKCYGNCSRSNRIMNEIGYIGNKLYSDFSSVKKESDDNNTFDKKDSTIKTAWNNWKNNNKWWQQKNNAEKKNIQQQNGQSNNNNDQEEGGGQQTNNDDDSNNNIVIGLKKDIIYQ